MTELELVIGNKKYSSWSLRPWLAMKVKGINFKETLAHFDHSDANPLKWNPGFADFSASKKVPVLKHNELTIWDSLAILEYLADIFPEKDLWPRNKTQRAHARSISNEMHSGFFALRDECPMNMARAVSAIEITDKARRDAARIEEIWAQCLTLSGGPYLFGPFTIADAMYAPIVNRFEKYMVSNASASIEYADTIKLLPAWREWEKAGAAEPWVCDIAEK